jgi:hypothetical protein
LGGFLAVGVIGVAEYSFMIPILASCTFRIFFADERITILPDGTPIPRAIVSILQIQEKIMRCLGMAALGVILALAGTAGAQEMASATIIQTGTDGSNFDYAIQLTDTGQTTIGSWWYGWIPGYNFLASTPTVTSNPTGWTDSVIPGYAPYAGASVQWFASGPASYIQPGGSVTFDIRTPDDLTTMTGPSPYGFGYYDSGDSYVYSQGLEADSGGFLEVIAPEPTGISLIAVSAAFALKRRRWNA